MEIRPATRADLAALKPLFAAAFQAELPERDWIWKYHENPHRAVSAVALTSVPLSGQVHLALGAIPFFVLYALVRTRTLWPAVCGCVVAAVGAGILVRQTVIVGSTQAGGRSLDEVASYSARVSVTWAMRSLSS